MTHSRLTSNTQHCAGVVVLSADALEQSVEGLEDKLLARRRQLGELVQASREAQVLAEPVD